MKISIPVDIIKKMLKATWCGDEKFQRQTEILIRKNRFVSVGRYENKIIEVTIPHVFGVCKNFTIRGKSLDKLAASILPLADEKGMVMVDWHRERYDIFYDGVFIVGDIYINKSTPTTWDAYKIGKCITSGHLRYWMLDAPTANMLDTTYQK